MKFQRSLLVVLSLLASGASAHAQNVIYLRAPSAWLGFSYSSRTEVRSQDGEERLRETVITVDTVVPESPAAEAGLRKGDVIREVNGLRASPQLIGSLSSTLRPDDTVTLTIARGDDERRLNVVAAERPADYPVAAGRLFDLEGDSVRVAVREMIEGARARVDSMVLPRVMFRRGDGDVRVFGFDADSVFFRDLPDSLRLHMDSTLIRLREGSLFNMLSDSAFAGRVLSFERDGDDFAVGAGPMMRGFLSVGINAIGGAVLQEVSPGLGDYFGVDAGLLVVSVSPDTPAARAGLEEGDVIVRAGDIAIDDVGQLRSAVRRADEELKLEVVRKRRNLTLTLPLD